MLNKNQIKRVAEISGKIILSFLFVFAVSTSRPAQAKDMKGDAANSKHPEDKGGFHREKMKHYIKSNKSDKNRSMHEHKYKKDPKHPEDKGGFHRERMKHGGENK